MHETGHAREVDLATIYRPPTLEQAARELEEAKFRVELRRASAKRTPPVTKAQRVRIREFEC